MKAVIFDMDGVIFDTEGFKFEAFRRTFAKRFNIAIEEDEERMGKGQNWVMQYYLDKHHVSGDLDELVEEKVKEFLNILQTEEVKIFPGAEDLLKYLRRKET